LRLWRPFSLPSLPPPVGGVSPDLEGDYFNTLFIFVNKKEKVPKRKKNIRGGTGGESSNFLKSTKKFDSLKKYL